MSKLTQVREVQESYLVKKLAGKLKNELVSAYRQAKRRLIILDYDGTLVPIRARPREAAPDPELVNLLNTLAADPKNDVVVASGRRRGTMSGWFGRMDISLVACHGAWLKPKGQDWQLIEALNDEWKEQLLPIFELFKDRTPGSTVEEKECALAWHFRQAEPELAALRAGEFKDILFSVTGDLNLDVLEGKKVLEVKHANVSKANVASLWLARENWEFILAAGDDSNDEALFAQLPDTAYSIKIGLDISEARAYLESSTQLRQLLNEIVK
jgi:trehalose 6-phosphate synthase/phosphatase